MDIHIKTRQTEGSTLWELFHKGHFVIGARNVEEIDRRLYQLIAANWQYLDCLSSQQSDPAVFIEHVAAHHQTLQLQFDYLQDGRTFMSGYVIETGTEFRYLILDRLLATRLQQRIDASGLRPLSLVA